MAPLIHSPSRPCKSGVGRNVKLIGSPARMRTGTPPRSPRGSAEHELQPASLFFRRQATTVWVEKQEPRDLTDGQHAFVGVMTQGGGVRETPNARASGRIFTSVDAAKSILPATRIEPLASSPRPAC